MTRITQEEVAAHSGVQSHHNLLTQLRIFDQAGGLAALALAMGEGRDDAGDGRGRRRYPASATPSLDAVALLWARTMRSPQAIKHSLKGERE